MVLQRKPLWNQPSRDNFPIVFSFKWWCAPLIFIRTMFACLCAFYLFAGCPLRIAFRNKETNHKQIKPITPRTSGNRLDPDSKLSTWEQLFKHSPPFKWPCLITHEAGGGMPKTLHMGMENEVVTELFNRLSLPPCKCSEFCNLEVHKGTRNLWKDFVDLNPLTLTHLCFCCSPTTTGYNYGGLGALWACSFLAKLG